MKVSPDENSETVFEGVPCENQGQMPSGSLFVEWLHCFGVAAPKTSVCTSLKQGGTVRGLTA